MYEPMVESESDMLGYVTLCLHLVILWKYTGTDAKQIVMLKRKKKETHILFNYINKENYFDCVSCLFIN
jgi:hypothetical protein